MFTHNITMAASGGGSSGTETSSKLYVDDVFSTYLYTGNGSTQTINNGIDLAGKGGLVWIKARSTTGSNHLTDTVRGGNKWVYSNLTQGQDTVSYIPSFNSNGFDLSSNYAINAPATTYTSWTFRKSPKFFDVVTWTGDGSTNSGGSRLITHGLGATPGFYIVKRTDNSMSWYCYHRSLGATKAISLNATGTPITSANWWFNVEPTSTTFSVNFNFNETDATYVAYLFAHDTSADGIIQCGSFTASGGGLATVTLGWEPQWILAKASSTTGAWFLYDTMRGIATGGNDNYLSANFSSAENFAGVAGSLDLTGSGFQTTSGGFFGNDSYIYLAIRRPNKPPTSGTQVYNAIARTGTGAAATVPGAGFAPDLIITDPRATGDRPRWWDRLRGANQQLQSVNTNAESTATDAVNAFGMDGFSLGADVTNLVNQNTAIYINWFFRRSPDFFDVVCYTGTGSAMTVVHNLGVAPELIIVKQRSTNTFNWIVYVPSILPSNILELNTNRQADQSSSGIFSSTPTSSVLNLRTSESVNGLGITYVAYLFASLSGISKVGNYTGNGSNQTINCGFSTGARFVLIKRTDSTGDWFTWDTARGIVAANDPHLSLNTTTTEVTTDDSIDPDSTGFIVNQNTATNINVLNGTYIYLAIA